MTHTNPRRPLFLLLLMTTISCVVSAGVYKWIDENGKVHFSDKKPAWLESKEVKLKVNTYSHVSFDSSIYDVGKKVVMYSTEWCKYCRKARKYFKENHIAFVEYDIEKNAKAKNRYVRMGGSGVPVILVGNRRMNGFSVEGFKRIYE